MLANLWFVPVSGVIVILVSYFAATALGCLPCLSRLRKTDYDALRIAIAFPNIVAFPILIFPNLCEYGVIHTAYTSLDPEIASPEEMARDCTAQATAMIFAYLFAWSVMFWCWGQQLLIAAGEEAKRRASSLTTLATVSADESDVQLESVKPNKLAKIAKTTMEGIKQTLLSPGFIALALGLITSLIPPLQNALFVNGGSMRWLGAAIESLSAASPSLGTIIVAASLNTPPTGTVEESQEEKEVLEEPNQEISSNDGIQSEDENQHSESETISKDVEVCQVQKSERIKPTNGDARARCATVRRARFSAIMSDPFYGPRKSASNGRRSSVKQISSRAVKAIRSPTMAMHLWFVLSRLVVAPAIMCALLIGFDCAGLLSSVSPLAKLVVLLNSSMPGALIVVVVLKSRELSETASVMAQVYLPSYLLCILTITAWTSIGLFISIPKNGSNMCGA